jgi:hypothetical protein
MFPLIPGPFGSEATDHPTRYVLRKLPHVTLLSGF